MQVRDFREGDGERLRALWVACGIRIRPGDHDEGLARFAARNPGLFLVAEEGTELAGSALAGWDGRRGWLYHVAVHPSWRRRGLATGLVREAERRLAALGCPKLNLIVWDDEPDAMRFWERVGYRRERTVEYARELAPAPAIEERAALFIAGAENVLRRQGAGERAFDEIAAALRELARSSGLADEAGLSALHGSGASSRIIGRGAAGSVLMLARFPSEAETPIHDHNSWGILCVVRGRDRHRRWARVDDGGVPGRATLRLVEEREVGEHETVTFGPPPADIHSQQGIGGAAWELVYFGADPDRLARSYYDVANGTVERRPGRS